MTRDQWADAGQRAAWTFVQGALAAAPVGPVNDWTALRSAAVVMGVAGAAAVLSLLKGMVVSRRSTSRQ